MDADGGPLEYRRAAEIRRAVLVPHGDPASEYPGKSERRGAADRSVLDLNVGSARSHGCRDREVSRDRRSTAQADERRLAVIARLDVREVERSGRVDELDGVAVHSL